MDCLGNFTTWQPWGLLQSGCDESIQYWKRGNVNEKISSTREEEGRVIIKFNIMLPGKKKLKTYNLPSDWIQI